MAFSDGIDRQPAPQADADEAELRSFLGGLCLEARHLRFFTAAVDLDIAAHWPRKLATIAVVCLSTIRRAWSGMRLLFR